MSKSVQPSNGTLVDYVPPQVADTQKPTDFWKNVCVGSVSGMSAVAVIQPLIYFKNIQQSRVAEKSLSLKQAFTFNPRLWYRGVFVFGGSFAPTIAIQTAANGALVNVWSPLVAATAAGVFSALAVCPAEGIMIQQQNTGSSMWQTSKHIYSNHGIRGFYRAFIPTTIREGVFTAAYLGAVPIAKEKIQSLDISEGKAQIGAGAAVGIVAAAASHPFDTFKTQMQKDFSLKTSLVQGVFQKKVFAGFGWRAAMVMIATTLMPFIQGKLKAHMDA